MLQSWKFGPASSASLSHSLRCMKCTVPVHSGKLPQPKRLAPPRSALIPRSRTLLGTGHRASRSSQVASRRVGRRRRMWPAEIIVSPFPKPGSPGRKQASPLLAEQLLDAPLASLHLQFAHSCPSLCACDKAAPDRRARFSCGNPPSAVLLRRLHSRWGFARVR